MPLSVEEIRRRLEVSNTSRNSDSARLMDSLPTTTQVEGTFLVDGSGEATKDIYFPTKFIERPSFTFGGELHLDTSPVAGHFPTISVVVYRWITDPLAPTDYSKIYFVGAHLVIVSAGPTAQRMWIHWRASARGIVNGTGTV